MTDTDKKHTAAEIVKRGIGVSPGIAIGRVYKLDSASLDAPAFCYMDKSYTSLEIKRFKNALKESKRQLLNIKKRIIKNGMGTEHISIIDAHIMMLEDKTLIHDTVKLIKADMINAEWALKSVLKDLRNFFSRIDDAYLRERWSDIEHIGDRIIRNLMGKKHKGIGDIKGEVIVVSHDIAPTDTMQMVKGNVLAFLTDVGGKTSHTAIVARSLEIPAVVGIENISQIVNDGDIIIVDGTDGTISINYSEKTLKIYKERMIEYANYQKLYHIYKDLPAETTDGHKVKLMGNIEMLEELPPLIEHGAEGIGLYRTEFLYLNKRHLPSEDEHLKAYQDVVLRIAPKPVTLRTLDIGGDKFLSQMDLAEEINPAMGLRAIRFCLKKPDIFKTQLRAMLRASAFGRVRIMFPMISGLDELMTAKSLLEESKEELRKEGRHFDENIKIGVMIEVPSSAVIADVFAKEVDFFSIGTNDLLQYTLAIDRGNEHVAYLYKPLHPAVLRIIKGVVDAAHDAGIEVGVCGEMAGEPEYAMVLVGLSVDNLSMNAFSILKVKKMIRQVSYSEIRKIAKEVLKFRSVSDTDNFIKSKMEGYR
ncbi:MAG: phosphoenolpyruvate--protein phosphotransferase [Deltaproteobacteria bacterium]|nr:phosphoenolpyruvate--protein phosphotransferase [Deltaproteobacteria bacterium]